MPIPRPPRCRWRWIPPSRTGGSSAATCSCSRRWVAASPGVRRWSATEGTPAQTRFAQEAKLDYGLALKSRGRKDEMADAGTIRRVDAGTLTRADLADVVHREIGLSRAESAGIVERILHPICAAFSEGQKVKIFGFRRFIPPRK